MTKKLTHAGCVVFQKEGDQTLFLVQTSSSGIHWVLPQGHIEKGESPDETALRELKEEAGVRAEIMAALSVREYQKPKEYVVVQYFLMRALGFTQTDEGRILRWESEQSARELLSFEAAREAVSEGAEIVRGLE